MCQTSTSRSSTCAAASFEPSGDHQWPRKRRISSAATNSARPQDVSGASGEASSRTPPSMSRTYRAPSTTNAMCSPSGVQPRVVDRAGRAQLARRTLDEVREEHPPADREHGAPDGVVGRVRRDARRALAGAFAPDAFGVGEVTLGLLRAGVEHQPLLRPRHVERPQAADRVVAGLRAQVDDAFAVGRDREGTRHAQRKAAGSGDLARELVERIGRLGHEARAYQRRVTQRPARGIGT